MNKKLYFCVFKYSQLTNFGHQAIGTYKDPKSDNSSEEHRTVVGPFQTEHDAMEYMESGKGRYFVKDFTGIVGMDLI